MFRSLSILFLNSSYRIHPHSRMWHNLAWINVLSIRAEVQHSSVQRICSMKSTHENWHNYAIKCYHTVSFFVNVMNGKLSLILGLLRRINRISPRISILPKSVLLTDLTTYSLQITKIDILIQDLQDSPVIY